MLCINTSNFEKLILSLRERENTKNQFPREVRQDIIEPWIYQEIMISNMSFGRTHSPMMEENFELESTSVTEICLKGIVLKP